MKAYSTDLRERVIGAAKQGMLQAEIAKAFAISISSIKRYLKQWRETATLEAKPIPGRPSKKLKPIQAGVGQLLASHIPQFTERKNTIDNRLNQADGECVDEGVATPESAFEPSRQWR